jgi:DNA-binding LytR/AlgR family response regulator
MDKIKVLIIEDDCIWQLRLEQMLSKHQEYEVCDSVLNISTAAHKIDVLKPDLLICDVFMDNENSLRFLKKYLSTLPSVIISSSELKEVYLETTLFEKSLFLVKPFHQNTLLSSLFHLSKKYVLPGREVYLKIRNGKKVNLSVRDIVYIQADGNYAMIHIKSNKTIARKISLNKLIPQLGQNFIRVHKSFIINKDFIDEVDFISRKIKVRLISIPIGRTYLPKLIVSDLATF